MFITASQGGTISIRDPETGLICSASQGGTMRMFQDAPATSSRITRSRSRLRRTVQVDDHGELGTCTLTQGGSSYWRMDPAVPGIVTRPDGTVQAEVVSDSDKEDCDEDDKEDSDEEELTLSQFFVANPGIVQRQREPTESDGRAADEDPHAAQQRRESTEEPPDSRDGHSDSDGEPDPAQQRREPTEQPTESDSNNGAEVPDPGQRQEEPTETNPTPLTHTESVPPSASDRLDPTATSTVPRTTMSNAARLAIESGQPRWRTWTYEGVFEYVNRTSRGEALSDGDIMEAAKAAKRQRTSGQKGTAKYEPRADRLGHLRERWKCTVCGKIMHAQVGVTTNLNKGKHKCL